MDFLIPFRQENSPATGARIQALISQLRGFAVERKVLEFSPAYQLGKKITRQWRSKDGHGRFHLIIGRWQLLKRLGFIGDIIRRIEPNQTNTQPKLWCRVCPAPDCRPPTPNHRGGSITTQRHNSHKATKLTNNSNDYPRRAQATPMKPSKARSELGSACGALARAPLRQRPVTAGVVVRAALKGVSLKE